MTMFDYDIQHIQGEENILADALSRIYDGMDADEIMDQDYLKEEGNCINTDTFLPDDPPSTQYMPCNITKHNSFAIATLNRRTTPLVIPTPHRENANLQDLENHPMCQKNVHQSPEPRSGNPIQQDGTNHCGFTELPFGTGCTAAPPFWEDCNATERCEAHLANHIDSYAHRLDGLPKRTFSGHSNDPPSTSTFATQAEPNAL